jgi:hypothetical protein
MPVLTGSGLKSQTIQEELGFKGRAFPSIDDGSARLFWWRGFGGE